MEQFVVFAWLLWSFSFSAPGRCKQTRAYDAHSRFILWAGTFCIASLDSLCVSYANHPKSIL